VNKPFSHITIGLLLFSIQKEAESQIQLLKDRCALLESTRDIPPTHVEETLIDPIAELHLDARDSFFLIGGSDGESPLAAMDMYCTSQNVIKSLKPMSCLRSYASVVELNGEIYVFGGGDDCVWFDSGMRSYYCFEFIIFTMRWSFC
jgi:kelch-like protein 20